MCLFGFAPVVARATTCSAEFLHVQRGQDAEQFKSYWNLLSKMGLVGHSPSPFRVFWQAAPREAELAQMFSVAAHRDSVEELMSSLQKLYTQVQMQQSVTTSDSQHLRTILVRNSIHLKTGSSGKRPNLIAGGNGSLLAMNTSSFGDDIQIYNLAGGNRTAAKTALSKYEAYGVGGVFYSGPESFAVRLETNSGSFTTGQYSYDGDLIQAKTDYGLEDLNNSSLSKKNTIVVTRHVNEGPLSLTFQEYGQPGAPAADKYIRIVINYKDHSGDQRFDQRIVQGIDRVSRAIYAENPGRLFVLAGDKLLSWNLEERRLEPQITKLPTTMTQMIYLAHDNKLVFTPKQISLSFDSPRPVGEFLKVFDLKTGAWVPTKSGGRLTTYFVSGLAADKDGRFIYVSDAYATPISIPTDLVF